MSREYQAGSAGDFRSLQSISVEAAAKQPWDVVVVGAGPAGATAALHLSQAGCRVLMLDRYDFPRDKVCGDALLPDAIRSLERSRLLEDVTASGMAIGLGTVFSPSRVEFDVPGQFVTIKRFVLDNLIVRKAMAVGAVFCRAPVTDIKIKDDGTVKLAITGCDSPVRSSIAIIATGASVDLASKLGVVEQTGPSAVALRCYVRSRLSLKRLVISYDRSLTPGYGWIFPLRNGEFNVGCGITYRKSTSPRVNLREAFQDFAKSFPLAIQLFRESEAVSPLQGAMLRCGLKGTHPIGPGNTLLIGESIGATFPFTGEGIGKAMETGEIAAQVAREALSSSSFDRLRKFNERVLRELKPKFLGYQLAEDWFSRPWLNDFLARRIRRSRFMQESLAGIVSETVDPKDVFSVRGVLRSLVR